MYLSHAYLRPLSDFVRIYSQLCAIRCGYSRIGGAQVATQLQILLLMLIKVRQEGEEEEEEEDEDDEELIGR